MHSAPLSDGGSSYDVAVPMIKKLLEACPETAGHAVVTGRTDPERVRKALQDIGFTDVSFTPFSASLFEQYPRRGQNPKGT